MKTILSILLFVSISIIYAEDINTDTFHLQYFQNPISISSEINFESNFQKSDKNIFNINSYKLTASMSFIDNITYLNIYTKGPIINKTDKSKEIDRHANFIFKIDNKKIILENPNKETILFDEYTSDYIAIPQLILPDKPIKSKEIWETTIYSPLFHKNINMENQIIRAYGDIVIIESKTKSPFGDTPIYSVNELEKIHYKNGTRFTFNYEDNIGTADISGNAIYYFNTKEGLVENYTGYFSIVGTLRPKNKQITIDTAKTDFLYLFMSSDVKYKATVNK